MDFKHRYGSVELYLQEEEDGPQIWARYAGAVRQGTCGPLHDTIDGELCIYRREVRLGRGLDDDAVSWIGYTGPHKGTEVWRSTGTNDVDTPFNPEVLEAAATLLLDDYYAFQEADRAMGDPYP